MKIVGMALWIIGAAIALFCLLGFDASVATATIGEYGVPQRVVNLDLQQVRSLIFSIGLAMFVPGVIVHALGHIFDLLSADHRAPVQLQMREHLSEALAVTPSATVTDDKALMAELGITMDLTSGQFHYGPYRYDKLPDAIAYARRERSKKE